MSRHPTAPICEANHTDAEHEERIRASIPDSEESVDIASLFSHLSDSTRIRLLSMLTISEMCVCEMADIINMSQPAVSHHLRILRQCGVVNFKKQGKRTAYYLSNTETGQMIKKFLGIVCKRDE